jgi:ATP-dependent RNA helicase DOB1
MKMLYLLQEVKKRFPNGIPLLNPITDMKIKDPVFQDVVKRIESFEERLYAHPLHKDPQLDSVYSLYSKKLEVSLSYLGVLLIPFFLPLH